MGRTEGLLVGIDPSSRRVRRLARNEEDDGDDEESQAEAAGDREVLEEGMHLEDTIVGLWGIRGGWKRSDGLGSGWESGGSWVGGNGEE